MAVGSTWSIFFFNDTATTEIYTLSLHDALPILTQRGAAGAERSGAVEHRRAGERPRTPATHQDRKSTRLNSSHANISYAVFCLKKKKRSLTLIASINYSILSGDVQ